MKFYEVYSETIVFRVTDEMMHSEVIPLISGYAHTEKDILYHIEAALRRNLDALYEGYEHVRTERNEHAGCWYLTYTRYKDTGI